MQETGRLRRSAATGPWERSRPTQGKRQKTRQGRSLPDSFRLAYSVHFLLHLGAVDPLAVAGQRLLPRGNRVGAAVLLQPQVPEVFLDDGVLRQLVRRGRERRVCEIELPLLDVAPPQAVEERRVVGLDRG